MYVPYLSSCHDKINLRKKWLNLAHSSKIQSMMVGKSWWEAPKSHRLCSQSERHPALWMVPPTFTVGPFMPITRFKRCLTDMNTGVSMLILNPTKTATEIRHHEEYLGTGKPPSDWMKLSEWKGWAAGLLHKSPDPNVNLPKKCLPRHNRTLFSEISGHLVTKSSTQRN